MTTRITVPDAPDDLVTRSVAAWLLNVRPKEVAARARAYEDGLTYVDPRKGPRRLGMSEGRRKGFRSFWYEAFGTRRRVYSVRDLLDYVAARGALDSDGLAEYLARRYDRKGAPTDSRTRDYISQALADLTRARVDYSPEVDTLVEAVQGAR